MEYVENFEYIKELPEFKINSKAELQELLQTSTVLMIKLMICIIICNL